MIIIYSLCNSFACEPFSAQPHSFKSWCYLTGFVMSSSSSPETVAGIECFCGFDWRKGSRTRGVLNCSFAYKRVY